MYNLLVSGDKKMWNGQPFTIEVDRCVKEYTDVDIASKYGKLEQTDVDEVKRFPCIFAYETGLGLDPKFGLITEIVKRQGKVRISYEVIGLNRFLSNKDILDLAFELDVSEWEMNRTHWAIKNVNLSKELGVKEITLPQGISRNSKAVDITKHVFDVALSFPGEIRGFVDPIAVEIEREIGPNSYFYDKNYTAQLARPSLDLLLQDLYGNRSKLIVVFLCKKYQEKEWCGIEFRAVQEIIKKRQGEKIMFIKMDNGRVDGVFETDGYIDGQKHTPKQIVAFIKDRVDLIS